jgi:hypothetical protein
LLAGLHYLALSEGLDPWSDPVPVLEQRREWLSRFVTTQAVQTNEVQRSWVLLPCFLEIARRTGVETFDLIELGPSAWLNLVWDRYRYRYEHGDWGDEAATLELAGEERRPVPAELLRLAPRVRQRRGIDLSPLDLTNPADTVLLKSLVKQRCDWPSTCCWRYTETGMRGDRRRSDRGHGPRSDHGHSSYRGRRAVNNICQLFT